MVVYKAEEYGCIRILILLVGPLAVKHVEETPF